MGLEEGRPLFVRTPEAKLTLANFLRTHLTASLAVLKNGMDLLRGMKRWRFAKFWDTAGCSKPAG